MRTREAKRAKTCNIRQEQQRRKVRTKTDKGGKEAIVGNRGSERGKQGSHEG